MSFNAPLRPLLRQGGRGTCQRPPKSRVLETAPRLKVVLVACCSRSAKSKASEGWHCKYWLGTGLLWFSRQPRKFKFVDLSFQIKLCFLLERGCPDAHPGHVCFTMIARNYRTLTSTTAKATLVVKANSSIRFVNVPMARISMIVLEFCKETRTAF